MTEATRGRWLPQCASWAGESITTHPPTHLSLQEAVLAYRNAYPVEHAMGRLKGRPLSLTPMSREREDHTTGLIRLWSLGWRVESAGAWPRPTPHWSGCLPATRSGQRLTRRLNACGRPFRG